MGKHLIKNLLNFDPSKRYLANEVLRHPWITRNPLDEVPCTYQEKWKVWELKRKLKQLLGIVIVAINKEEFGIIKSQSNSNNNSKKNSPTKATTIRTNSNAIIINLKGVKVPNQTISSGNLYKLKDKEGGTETKKDRLPVSKNSSTSTSSTLLSVKESSNLASLCKNLIGAKRSLSGSYISLLELKSDQGRLNNLEKRKRCLEVPIANNIHLRHKTPEKEYPELDEIKRERSEEKELNILENWKPPRASESKYFTEKKKSVKHPILASSKNQVFIKKNVESAQKYIMKSTKLLGEVKSKDTPNDTQPFNNESSILEKNQETLEARDKPQSNGNLENLINDQNDKIPRRRIFKTNTTIDRDKIKINPTIIINLKQKVAKDDENTASGSIGAISFIDQMNTQGTNGTNINTNQNQSHGNPTILLDKSFITAKASVNLSNSGNINKFKPLKMIKKLNSYSVNKSEKFKENVDDIETVQYTNFENNKLCIIGLDTVKRANRYSNNNLQLINKYIHKAAINNLSEKINSSVSYGEYGDNQTYKVGVNSNVGTLYNRNSFHISDYNHNVEHSLEKTYEFKNMTNNRRNTKNVKNHSTNRYKSNITNLNLLETEEEKMNWQNKGNINGTDTRQNYGGPGTNSGTKSSKKLIFPNINQRY